MTLERARAVFPYVARDLVAAAGARESFDDRLEAFAKRRALAYAPGAPQTEEAYWPTIASALAPSGPPAWMPLAGLIDMGFTLEGGARGLRGLFTKAPSEKERRRVQKTAALAWRVLELLVDESSRDPSTSRGRAVAMAIASFGLNPDEIEQSRPPSPMSFESIELFGEVDIKTRRELLRGAWTLALAGRVEPGLELAVRGIAQRLDLASETDALRAEVLATAHRQFETALFALELARTPARELAPEVARAWLDHLIDSAAPLGRREELHTIVHGSHALAKPEALPKLDGARRRQALVLAYATLMGHDPGVSSAVHIRAELHSLAEAVDAVDEAEDAFAMVDRYLTARLRELAVQEVSADGARESSSGPSNPALPPPTPPTPPSAAATPAKGD